MLACDLSACSMLLFLCALDDVACARCLQLSAMYTSGITARDEEDGRKLQAGIQIAIEKGVLEAQPAVRVCVLTWRVVI